MSPRDPSLRPLLAAHDAAREALSCAASLPFEAACAPEELPALLLFAALALAHPRAPSPRWSALCTGAWPALEPLLRAVDAQPSLAALLRRAVEPLLRPLEALDASSFGHALAEHCERWLARDTPLRHRHGVFFTPPEVARFTVEALAALARERAASLSLEEESLLLEPAVGAGALLLPTLEAGLSQRHLALDVLALPLLVTHLRAWLSGLSRGLLLHRGDALEALGPEGALGELAPRVALVLGNPPWAGHGAHTGRWGESLSALEERDAPDYFHVEGAPLGERNPKWLHDDYVRFVRLAQVLVARRGRGAVALVCNHGWLDQPTFRGMRASLLRTFDTLRVLDLGGNARRATDARDEGLFAIQHGACVLLAARTGGPPSARVAVLTGTREAKREALAEPVFLPVEPASPRWSLRPSLGSRAPEWERFTPLSALFLTQGPALVAGREGLVLAEDRELLRERFRSLREAPSSVARLLRPGDAVDPVALELTDAQLDALLLPCAWRPLEQRWILAHPALLERPRPALLELWREPGSLSLVARRRAPPGRPGTYAWLARGVVSDGILRADNLGTERVYPLASSRGPNLAPELLRALPSGAEPLDALCFVYAVLWSSAWRERYAQRLTEGEPRVPLALAAEPFAALARHGAALFSLHAPPDEAAPLEPFALGARCPEGLVRVPRDGASRSLLAPAVEPRAWALAVGSYALLERWLLLRRGRAWSPSLWRDFARRAALVEATLQRVAELDATVRSLGLFGGPGD